MRYHTGMNSPIPSAEHVAEQLRPLRMSALRDLAAKSGVPYRTLINIRSGVTTNPGLETVRKFLPLLPTNDQQAVEPVADICSTETVGQ